MKAVDLASALARARSRLGECSALKLQVLCEVAAGGDQGVAQLTLAMRPGATKQTISAAVRDLTAVDHRGRPGPGYVSIKRHPHNQRANIVRLTDAGRALAAELFGAG